MALSLPRGGKRPGASRTKRSKIGGGVEKGRVFRRMWVTLEGGGGKKGKEGWFPSLGKREGYEKV